MQEQAVAGRPSRTGRDVVKIDSEQRVIAAARMMVENNVGCLVVTNELGHLVGVLSERDILRWISRASPATFGAQVADIMTRDVVCAPGDIDPAGARRLMVENRIRHLPVVDHGVPVGMISMRDIVGV